MPELSIEEINELLENYLKDAKPVTISKDKSKKALELCDEYLKNENIDIHNMSNLSIYYIISKLSEEKQIKFIKENIDYIKENEQDIFLYDMLSPKSLPYFLSLKVLKEIKIIDIDLFKNIISKNQEDLFYGFTHQDYIEFYEYFFDEISLLDNNKFISGISWHNRCCYNNLGPNNLNNLISKIELQPIYNEEFIKFILSKYKEKIKTFTPNELLRFVNYIENIDIYKDFINNHYEKLSIAFNNINDYELSEYLENNTTKEKQEILIYTFFDSIIKKQDIIKIIYKISPSIIIELYNKDKQLFNTMTLKDWIKVCTELNCFNNDFKKILDTFEIHNIEDLFDTNFFTHYHYKRNIETLKYIELKYRNNINNNGILNEIDNTTSIFCYEYLSNLKELKFRFKNKNISKNHTIYKKHLTNFILFLQNEDIINNIEGNNFKEIDKLFYKIIMGMSITIVYQISSIQEITILNRLGKIDFNVNDFSVCQLEQYNVKHHRQLYEQFEDNWQLRSYKTLILKLMFMIGFNHTKNLLKINNDLSILEHLAGNVDVKNIILDEQGNPILNNKIMNFLFTDKNYSRVQEMLENQDNDLYKYFPRIFNEWEMIIINGKDKSLKMVIEFLKSYSITLPPEYYRLNGLFKFIGCSNSIVNETLALHNQILTRNISTIPRVIGTKDDYEYEILKLDDMEGIALGNKTDCCFTVLGNGYDCLKHALTNKNGRILVIRKDSEILAHSWIWRNGDLLCLDNIEISKKIDKVDFLDVYLDFTDKILEKSFNEEGIDSCIKNITIGFTNFDKPIIGIENYPCLIASSCNLEKKTLEVDLVKIEYSVISYPNLYNIQVILIRKMFNI